MGLFKAPPATVRELLTQHYAYLVRAAAARNARAQRYTTEHHALAVAFYRDVLAGRKRIGSFFHEERARLGVARCAYCGETERLSVDHLVPRLAGGPDDANNLIPACRPCNSSKGSSDVMAWHVRKGRFPRRAVVRRYVKLAWRWCERHHRLDCPVEDPGETPFDLSALSAATRRTGIGGDDGRYPMRWD